MRWRKKFYIMSERVLITLEIITDPNGSRNDEISTIQRLEQEKEKERGRLWISIDR